MHTRHQVRRAIAAEFCLASLIGVSSVSVAAPPVLTGVDKAADVTLPASAMRGTGIAGTFNPNVMVGPQMTFALPDGRTITAKRQRLVADQANGRKSWVGTFTEQPGSIVSISTFKGATTGFVSYGTETWELMPAKGGNHVLYRVDDKKLPTAEPVLSLQATEYDVAAVSDYGTDSTTAGAGGYVHDLLVVYTPRSKALYGQATLESMVQNAVVVANQAYQNSGIGITLNLVGLQEISYVETGAMQTSLFDLQGTTDGKMDTVHKLRDSLGADIVSLVSEDGDSCGIAWAMRGEYAGFASNAFNVVKSGCMSNHTLAHEVGHNQGNMHDRASTSNTGAFPYSYGYRRCLSDGTGFRTVMSYACSGANRVAWFSNPNAYYNGYPAGIAYETDAANSADNARSMNNTADTVAAFRGAAGTTPLAPVAPTSPSGLSAAAVAYNSVTVKWADNSGDETGFKLERSGNGVDFVEIATLGAGTTSYADNGVLAASTYYYRARAYNSAGNSSYSNTGSVTTPTAPPPPPVAPSSVSALNGANGTATVLWADASTNESSFEVRREKWDAKRLVWTGLTTVGTVPANVTSLSDLTGNGTFRYSVRAVNNGGASGLAGPAPVTVTGGASKGKSGR